MIEGNFADTAQASGKVRGLGALGRLRRDQRGASMVEFALVGVPFFILLMGTFEIGFIYWVNQELEHATGHAARLVRTGQVQAGTTSQSQLKTVMCSQTSILVGCATRLRIDVRSGKSFSDISPPLPLDSNGSLKDDASFAFSPGAGSDFVLVSAFYNWHPLLKPSDYILRASSVARNEPF
jgi:Flp pilus assembly protein TadG